jgi:hypothetical protein
VKRVAGTRRQPTKALLTSELPFIRVYSPVTTEMTNEVMAMWRKSVGNQTGRTWCVARENDLFVRLYMLPERRHGST